MTEQESGPTLPRFPELEAEFEIVRELGRGGTAIVYLARDRELGRDVAIKLIRPSYLQDEEAIARLEREARTVGKLQHPNIVLLLGSRRLGKHGLALILQYVPGENLKEHLRHRGRLPVERVRAILADVATGLDHAHRRRIVHRDIKPENVYLDEDAGVARLADFGIARAWDSDSGLTLPGTALGTPAYMSPEQVDGRDLDGRSDVYSLGLLAWEMLTGEAPWSGESLYNIIYKQKHERLRPVTEIRDDVPEALAAVLDRALEKDPAARWHSAAQFLEALRSPGPASGHGADTVVPESGPPVPRADTVVPELSQPVPGPSLSKPQSRPPRRRWLVIVGAALIVVVAGLLLQGPDTPLESILQGGSSDLSESELPWDRWERPLEAAGGDAAGAPAPDGSSRDPEADGRGVDGAGAGGEGIGADTEGIGASTEVPGSESAAPPGSTLQLIQGAEQVGSPSTLLNQSLILVAQDSQGSRLPGVPVRVEVMEGGGTTSTSTATSDSQGFVVFQWRLGPEEGAQRIQVGFPGSDATPLQLSALARAPLPQVDITPDEVTFQPSPGARVTPDLAAPSPGLDDPLPSVLSPQATVAAGATHSCSLDRSGSVYCWGSGAGGRLGLGDGSSRDRPARVPGTFARLAVGTSHTCALDTGGTAYCWGANNQGQLGDGTSLSRNEPTPVPGLPPLLDITVGAGHTCALDTLGRPYCWGNGGQGQLGDGTTSSRTRPVLVAGNRRFREIAAGWEHTCALDADGRAYCWGAGGQGQLGWVGIGSGAVPGSVQGSHRFTRIAPGNAHTCGVTTDGAALCWGQGTSGQLGDGSSDPARSSPAPVRGDERFRDIAAGATHSCALTTAGSVWCWGGNANGQLGDGAMEDRAEPTPVNGDVNFSMLTGLGSHVCGLTSQGEVFCWGANGQGQLGDGTRNDRAFPGPVGGAG